MTSNIVSQHVTSCPMFIMHRTEVFVLVEWSESSALICLLRSSLMGSSGRNSLHKGMAIWYQTIDNSVFVNNVCIGLTSAAFYDDEKSLRTAVLNGYEYKIRPASSVTVNVKLSLLNINLLDVPTQQLSVSGWLVFDIPVQRLSVGGWLSLSWTDERLVWNTSDYGGIEDIYDTEAVLWRPEIIVDNSVSNLGVISDDALLIRATYLGEMTWEPPGIFETHCDVDVTYYPFDTQICVVEVTSWAYTLTEVSLEAEESTINFDDFEKSGEWDVLDSWTERKILVDGDVNHSEVVFTLKLKRKPAYYVMTILLPVVVTSLLCGLVFMLPVESGEKVGYSLTILLTYSVIITLVASYMPPTSKHTSVLSVYNTLILFVGGVCVLLTVFVLYCYHQPEDEEPPCWLLTLTRKFLAPVARVMGKRRWVSGGRSSTTPDGSNGGRAGPLTQLVARNDSSASDVKVVGLGGRKLVNNNAVHPGTPTQTRPKSVKEAAGGRRQSYHYGDPHSVDGLEFSWQDISVLLDSACIRLFGLFVLILTVVVLLALIVGGSV
ncbi:hypothetical protein RRG08_034531 [Elysia crispata]|uniref:Uncharacterized protein n=1 Tax=Elysia crispata TaxID=231223 RepID=A0AAE1BBJ7_9GAST|nr:hypothetical protein RRG08_034531 [Elysia crispata]